jgi:CMP/dCMP kinase
MTRVTARATALPAVGPPRVADAGALSAGGMESAPGGILRAVATTQGTEPTVGTRHGVVVALDGPSSSGKSTVGAEAARRLRYRFCDTGLLYRAVTWLALARGIAPSDVPALVALVPEVQLIADARGRMRHVQAAGTDVTSEVRGAAVDRAVSDYSRVPELRAALIGRQRAMAGEGGGIIMAGRDIGTVILPDAAVKIYLNASAEVRARRRAAQRRTTDESEAGQILAELRTRDSIDSSRETAPLRTAPDAVIIHTDGNGFAETVDAVIRVIRAAEGDAGGR